MSAIALDPAAARTVARSLSSIGEQLYREALALRANLGELALAADGFVARRALEQTAEAMWRDAAFLGLVSDRVDAADAGRFHSGTFDIGELWRVAGGLTRRHGWLGPLRDLFGASPIGGDGGGTFDAEPRRSLHVYGVGGVERARSLLARLLADLSDPVRIRKDEFEVVQLADDRYIVVLAGVTDLSALDPFLNDDHRSVRDLDRYAVPSLRSSAVADNRYAQMVWQALVAAEVPAGSELMIVGHSFGADTALDLASDAAFNGELYRVTHVVAAGYHSQPQLRDVRGDTEVLVLQNFRDAAVISEGVAQSHATKAVESRVRLLGDLATFDLSGVADGVRDIVTHDIGAAIDVGEYAFEHADDAADIAIGVGAGRWELVVGATTELVTLQPRVERVGEHAVVDVFEGGAAGVGHHPSNYIDHVAAVDHPEVVAFFESLAARGYDADGSVVAIDVSVS